MTQEQAKHETQYQLARCIFLRLREDGSITDAEFKRLLKAAVDTYSPLIGELEVNSIAGEDNYQG